MVDVDTVAAKLDNSTATYSNNYWSPLSCLVKEQENNEENTQTNVDTAMTATTVTGHANKVAAHWAKKLANRQSRKSGILDTEATSGAAPEEDKEAFEDTGELSRKMFMFPDKQTNKATKKMLLKHKLCLAAREMNIVPALHSTLVSVPKLADAGNTTVFSKTGAAIYDDNTTTITTNKPPVLDANRCNTTSARGLPRQQPIPPTEAR
jgi:hypothetical protein